MITHNNNKPIRTLQRQKRIIAEDYPFFAVSLWKCNCGCNGYYVTLQKVDIGYSKKLFDIEFERPLEAFIKFEKFVKECEEGKYNRLSMKECQMFE